MQKAHFRSIVPPAQSDRDKRGDKRSIDAAKADIVKNRNNLKLEIKANRERVAKEEQDELKERKQRQLAAAIKALDRINPGNAHQNFHGILDISETFDVPINTLRRQYVEHRAKIQARTGLPAIEAEDPDRMLKVLVDRCVIGGEQVYKVYSENECELKGVFCCKTAFYDIISRRKLDPLAPLRLKRGRPEMLTEDLILHITSNKSKDLNGNFNGLDFVF